MKKTKIVLLIFVIIILVSSIFISTGLYLNRISKPNYIFSKGIDICKNKIDNYSKISNDLDLGDKLSIKGNIEFDLDSEYYKDKEDPEEKKISNLINNLNKLNTTFKIQKNQHNNTGYIELNEVLEKEELLSAKYFINDSTKYFYINNVVDTFINDGSCNYFENINTNTTEKENIEYLYNFVVNSIKNNLDEKFFTHKEEKNSYVVTLKIDDSNLKDILNGVLKDLKKDKRSRKILDNIDKDILKTKIKEEDTYLGKNEYYKIYIYTTKVFHKPLKYKVEVVTKDSINTYIYEGNENKGTFYYLVNDTEKYKVAVEFKKDEIKGKIKNSKDKNVGEFKLEKNNYNTTLNYTYNENDEKIDLIYSSKYSKVKKNEKYKNKKNLSFKYVVNKETKLSGEVDINLDVSNKFSIILDTSDAKLKSNMTKEEKDKMNNLYEDIKNRLER